MGGFVRMKCLHFGDGYTVQIGILLSELGAKPSKGKDGAGHEDYICVQLWQTK